jgi:uncharacterized protein (TIGR02001 family)
MTMNRRLIATCALAASTFTLPTVSFAVEEGPESPAAFNISLTTDYRYRGISQSRLEPALQGGYDFSHSSGIYLGTWASTIKWIKDAGEIAKVDTGNATFEWDFYGGWKTELSKDVTLDLGGLYYYYMNNKYANIPGAVNTNTFEIYGAVTFGVVTAKYSHSLTNLFGYANSKGSGYLDLNATFDLGDGWSLIPHYGYQKVSGNSIASYNDVSLILGKDLGKGFNVSVGGYVTDANDTVYVSPEGKFLGKSGLVAMIKFNF